MSEWAEKNRVFINLNYKQLLTLVVYGEARGEGIEGQKAVINVIKNRVKKGGWFVDKEIEKLSSAICGVILKKYQFSCFLETDANRKKLEFYAENFNAKLKTDKVFKQIYDLTQTDFEDNTNGAVFYHEQSISPKWKETVKETARIGHHIFYA